MAHLLDMSNGRANIAYAGQKPWHGLGFKIDSDASIDEWQRAAGLDWQIKRGGIALRTEEGEVIQGVGEELNRSILYRSDTKAPLSVVSSDGFHVVQPAEIVDFIGSSAKAMGWKMETLGSLAGGRKIWGLANIGEQADIGKGDRVKGYLLAATACDGSMASIFKFTSVRVVCNNTLQLSRDKANDSGSSVKVYHYNALDVDAVKQQLGIATDLWARFIENAKRLSAVKVSRKKAVTILRSVYDKPAEKIVVGDSILTEDEFLAKNASARRILELYQGQAIGADLATSNGTAWGLVNATTEFYDHASKTRSTDNRLNSAWFGRGAEYKAQVFDACLQAA